MNKGVGLAQGRWMFFLGSDDELLNGFSDVPHYLKDDHTVYYGNVDWPKLGRIYDGSFNKYKLAVRNICHQCIFYPHVVWRKYSYDLKHPVFSDYALNLACFNDKEFRWEHIPVTVAVFHSQEGLSRGGEDAVFNEFKLNFVAENFPKPVAIAISARIQAIRVLKMLGWFSIALRFRAFILNRFR